MPVVPPAKLAQLQSNVHSIRNVCVLAHVDHGKTTLSDALLATNGIISSKLAGKVRYLDSREDEQERGITMESSGISLYYQLLKRATDSTSSDTSLTASEYLVNLIDSPGHVDFASEVASAARLSDGALVLVDVVEGVCTQTVSVLRQAWIENVQPILFLNKMDRLIVEWKMTPSEAYIHMQQLIEQVNAVLAGFWEGDRLAEDSRKLEEAKERWKEAHSEDVAMTEWYLEEKDDSHIYFAPEQGNVLFGSAMDGWAFRVNHFANIFAEKLGIPTPAKLQQLMWGSYYMDPKNKQRVLTNKQLAKLYGPAKAATALPLFVQLCLVSVWQVYESVILEHNQDRIEKVIAALELKVLPRDRRSKDHRVLLTAIMQGWLPLAQACMVAIVEQLPSPAAAQPLRLPPLVQGKTQSLADRKTTEPKNEVERALYSCTAGTTSVPAPLVAYVSKVISVPRESLPEFSSEKSLNNRAAMTAEEMRARGRAAVRQEFALSRDSAAGTPLSAASVAGDTTPNSSGIATPLSVVPSSDISVDSLASAMREKLAVGDTSTEATSDSVNSDPDSTAEEILIGFGRIYSGVVRVGDQIWAMQPKYSAKDANSQSYCKQITVRALYMMMGREFVSLPEVPAGNVFGIRGISGAILKSGTLASDAQTCPNLAAMHSETYPIVRVALEPVNPQDMAKLVRGLELLNQADPCVQVISQATGERVLVTAGELHLERCMKDLRERFAKCEIHVSEPIVPFREGIARQSAQPGVVLGEIGSNGQSLAIIPKAVQGGAEPAEATETRTKPDEGTPRGEVCITTANGLVTITLQVEPLPERTTRFLLRHEDDIRRVARLSSSRRHSRLNAAAEALASVDDSATPLAVAANEASDNDDDGNTNEPRPAKPSRTSELGPWLQGRLRSTFRKAKGWEPQRVGFATDNGLCSFGPRKAGPNMLLYSKEVLEQSSKPKTSWFRRRTHDTALSSTGATPMLSDDEEESDVEEAAAPVATRTAYTIRDFEESVNAGFQLATQSGPLCFEPLVGVAVTIKSLVSNLSGSDSVGTSGLSGQIISAVRDAIKAGFLHWSPRLHLAMYTCDIQATSEVLGKVYGVINRRRGRVLSEEMREGTPYFSIKSAIPIVESFGFADEIRKRTSGAAIPLLIYRGFESLDMDPFWVPTTEEELEDLGEKADRDNVAKRYMDKVRKRKGLFVERKIIEHAEKQRTLKNHIVLAAQNTQVPEPWVGGDFGHIARKNGLIVDKMLICKALIDYNVEAICVCLPRRFGKTFNLSIVEEFFNVVTSNDVKPVDGAFDLEASRTERLKLFEEFLLHTTERELFDEHFCRYPVIRINFKLEKTAQHWELQESDAENIFVRLSNLLCDTNKSQYVVLFDEYDKPLKAIRGQPWEKAAVETYTSLVNKVFKDNND
ncbi:Cytoplasmic GTPase/eEF2-like protein (ribosomal biogenesis) [Coemansia sp. S16]|nr:Cytoplasmic GTPase/eEF2-like protein (ribosomal biogenesis) [Coemansia sp. S16]